MDYTFKINDGLKSVVSMGKNMQFGVTAGNSGNNVIPDGVVTSSSIKHIETVTKQWYDTNPHNKDTIYVIKSER